jgi:hypothetical protein
MDPVQTASLPARPAALPEWEDLLVRFEIMPRALRVTLEEAGRDPVGAAGILRRMVVSETLFSHWIERASPGGAVTEDRPSDSARSGDLPALADRFASLRSRNFAMLQRRGIDVWEWAAPLEGAGLVTAHQMVASLVLDDAAALRALREGARLGAAAC